MSAEPTERDVTVQGTIERFTFRNPDTGWAVVRLLDVTSLRVGNTEYALSNKSFGLTTLRNRHAVVRGSTIRASHCGRDHVSRFAETR